MKKEEKNKKGNNGKTCTASQQKAPKRLSKAGQFMRKYGNRGEIVDMRAVLK